MTGTPVIRPRRGAANLRRPVAMRTLSIVVPVKDEHDNVEPLYRKVKDVLRDALRLGGRLRGRREHRRDVRRTDPAGRPRPRG